MANLAKTSMVPRVFLFRRKLAESVMADLPIAGVSSKKRHKIGMRDSYSFVNGNGELQFILQAVSSGVIPPSRNVVLAIAWFEADDLSSAQQIIENSILSESIRSFAVNYRDGMFFVPFFSRTNGDATDIAIRALWPSSWRRRIKEKIEDAPTGPAIIGAVLAHKC